MPHFFIERPVFAWVVSIFIILFGALTATRLPTELYPEIAPTQVTIYAVYPGATPQTLNDSVIEPIEREITAVENLLYFESSADTSGMAQITVTFQPGTDHEMAQVQVQNQVAQIEPRLPQAVRALGLTILASSSTNLMVVTLTSPDGRYDGIELGDYMARSVVEELKRIDGVGRVQIYGAPRAMRVWIDPVALTAYNVGVEEVANAIRGQNYLVSPGRVGAAPAVPGQRITMPLVVRGELESVEEFENVLIRANPDGSRILLSDVATLELGAESYNSTARLNGAPVAAAGVQLSPGANAVATANNIYKRLEEIKTSFPDGVDYVIPFDTAPYVKTSLLKVMQTFVEALLLVFLIMYLFLQNVRATFIPALVAPIALLGTFGIMFMTGYSVNTLTMFGMILAIGIIVDDAIVVVENVERIMAEEGLPPKEATIKAMHEITGAVIGITLVLSAVFLPIAMASGAIGTIYRQFSLSMAVSILFSAFLALSLTPALCATMLKPHTEAHTEKRGFFGWFNRSFERFTDRYTGWVGWIVRRGGRTMIVYLAICIAAAWMFNRLPGAFLPEEDQGSWISSVQLDSDATTERTDAVLKEYLDYVMEREDVQSVVQIQGFGFAGSGPNVGLMFNNMVDFPDRKGSDVFKEVQSADAAFAGMTDGSIINVVPPSIRSLGNSAGFAMRLIDRRNQGQEALLNAQNVLLQQAFMSDVVLYAYPEGLGTGPMVEVNVDREAAETLGVPFSSIGAALTASFGSMYINDFPNAGRQQQVIIQAKAESRMHVEDVMQIPVASRTGQTVPLGSVANAEVVHSPLQLVRYNGNPAIRLGGIAAPGFSSGQAMAEMERIVAEQLPTFEVEWTGLSYQERLSGDEAPLLMLLSLLVVFLVLAALYESWSIPFSVILVVPLGVIGALIAVSMRGLANDIFFKVGLVTLIGLSAKNAILIVEFAKQLEEDQGWAPLDAAVHAAKLRLRPILMTSLAFGLGVTPMVLASGASATTQHAIGTGVVGGMVSGTILAVLFVPAFYVVIRKVFRRTPKDGVPTNVAPPLAEPETEHGGLA